MWITSVKDRDREPYFRIDNRAVLCSTCSSTFSEVAGSLPALIIYPNDDLEFEQREIRITYFNLSGGVVAGMSSSGYSVLSSGEW